MAKLTPFLLLLLRAQRRHLTLMNVLAFLLMTAALLAPFAFSKSPAYYSVPLLMHLISTCAAAALFMDSVIGLCRFSLAHPITCGTSYALGGFAILILSAPLSYFCYQRRAF